MSQSIRSTSRTSGDENAPTAILEPKFRPVYKSRGATRVGNHWECYSVKLGRRVHLYSDLEYDNWLLVEGNPDVETYCEQPCYAYAWHEGVVRASIPDMWVKYKDGSEAFFEIKFSKDLEKKSPRVIKQIETQRKWAEGKGIRHSILTEKDIRKNPLLLSNLSKMAHAVRVFQRTRSMEDVILVQTELKKGFKADKESTRLGDIFDAECFRQSKENGMAAFSFGIFNGLIVAPIDSVKIGIDMIIKLNPSKT